MVTEPGDVLALLESPARHAHDGTHAARYLPAPANLFGSEGDEAEPESEPAESARASSTAGAAPPEDDLAGRILRALEQEQTADDLAERLGVEVSKLRAALTLLEMTRRVRRVGSRFAKVR